MYVSVVFEQHKAEASDKHFHQTPSHHSDWVTYGFIPSQFKRDHSQQLSCCHKKHLSTTFSTHLPAALHSLPRKTEVTLKLPHFYPAKTEDRINRWPEACLYGCVCESKEKNKKQLYRQNSVCAVLNSQENPVALWVIHLINKAGFPSAAAVCMCVREYKGERHKWITGGLSYCPIQQLNQLPSMQ